MNSRSLPVDKFSTIFNKNSSTHGTREKLFSIFSLIFISLNNWYLQQLSFTIIANLYLMFFFNFSFTFCHCSCFRDLVHIWLAVVLTWYSSNDLGESLLRHSSYSTHLGWVLLNVSFVWCSHTFWVFYCRLSIHRLFLWYSQMNMARIHTLWPQHSDSPFLVILWFLHPLLIVVIAYILLICIW